MPQVSAYLHRMFSFAAIAASVLSVALSEEASKGDQLLVAQCLQVGAGEVTGNPLFQAFDEAIRGRALGETAVLEAKGGEWRQELFFKVQLKLILLKKTISAASKVLDEHWCRQVCVCEVATV